MPAKKRFTAPDWDPETAPDLSTPEYRARLDAASVKRGRPPIEHPKVSTTIRLDADVLEAFKAKGAGWQSRINDALRRAARLRRRKSAA
ncbi:MAG: hypothetical protein E7774_07695 [Bradyrhizobium sp.]|nr:MAG: hypothetical protein E7774_07695 [Bradyrhizobium sp.]